VDHGLLLTLAYDGTDFAGFQAQQGQRTVQAVVAAAAARICRHEVLVRGASRTDSGVHAQGQVVAFATGRDLEPARWLQALNRYLPPDVAVRAASQCAPEYEPRFDARDKTYRYVFHLGPTRDPSLRRNAWHVGRQAARRGRHGCALELDAMRAACAQLKGTHDFRAFRAAADTRLNTERTLLEVALIEQYAGEPGLLALEIQGNAFMMNMMRILAGTLVDVGRGKLTLDRFSSLLRTPGHRRDAGITAPAHGLTLVAVTLGRLRAEASR
jgi:tRNA pseudouridine38-40 synthase